MPWGNGAGRVIRRGWGSGLVGHLSGSKDVQLTWGDVGLCYCRGSMTSYHMAEQGTLRAHPYPLQQYDTFCTWVRALV